MEVSEVKNYLASRQEDYDRQEIEKINIVERTLSEKLSNVIGTFLGPRVATRAR